jgi:seryl-tRNA synthetase
LDQQRRELQQIIDDLHHQRNELSKTVNGKPSSSVIEKSKKLKVKLDSLTAELKEVSAAWQALLDKVPNIPSQDTPIGESEADNVVVRTVGTKPHFSFQPQAHWDLGSRLDIIDNERAAKVAGSRFTYLKREAAWLQFALIQYVLSIVTDRNMVGEIIRTADLDLPDTPFIPVVPPVLVKRSTMYRMARLDPEEERYATALDDLFLVGSAEHSMGALHMDEVLSEDMLPLRYIGFSTAFRREAGSHGKDVRGILRLHQFDKLEMETFSLAEHSVAEHALLVALQEYVMQGLGLAYQVVLKCTADMGAPNHRAIDIETWMPGQDRYRETHTADLMTDYQARRLNTKVARKDGTVEYAHMNDATALAIGRTLIAVLENYQQEDGSIAIPSVLHPYVPFTVIKKH